MIHGGLLVSVSLVEAGLVRDQLDHHPALGTPYYLHTLVRKSVAAVIEDCDLARCGGFHRVDISISFSRVSSEENHRSSV